MSGGGQKQATLLMVGDGEPMAAAVERALKARNVAVFTTRVSAMVEAVMEHAPDLVLLTGDAAADGGDQALGHIAENPVASVVPVALLAEDTSLDHRLRAFRSGAVAVIQRQASADAIAREVAQVVRELPERSGETSGELGEATLDELVDLLSRELRRGILAVDPTGQQSEAESLRLVLGAGRPVSEALEGFVERLRPLIAKAEPLRYEFHEEPGGRLGLLEDDGAARADAHPNAVELLHGLRILLMDNDPGRADALAQALRGYGALVGVTEVSVAARERARGLDPEVIVLDAGAIEGRGFETVRTLRKDSRLRWAALLVASWDELWPDTSVPPDIDRLASRIAPLLEPDHELARRAREQSSFDTRLEQTGPSRLLRTLLRMEGTRHATIGTPTHTVEVDLSGGLVVGARALSHGDGADLEGTDALAVLLSVSTARVHVERREHPSVANIMAPVDEALGAAAGQAPRSVPPETRPSGMPLAPEAPAAAAPRQGDVEPPARRGRYDSDEEITVPRDRDRVSGNPSAAEPPPGPRNVKKTLAGVAPEPPASAAPGASTSDTLADESPPRPSAGAASPPQKGEETSDTVVDQEVPERARMAFDDTMLPGGAGVAGPSESDVDATDRMQLPPVHEVHGAPHGELQRSSTLSEGNAAANAAPARAGLRPEPAASGAGATRGVEPVVEGRQPQSPQPRPGRASPDRRSKRRVPMAAAGLLALGALAVGGFLLVPRLLGSGDAQDGAAVRNSAEPAAGGRGVGGGPAGAGGGEPKTPTAVQAGAAAGSEAAGGAGASGGSPSQQPRPKSAAAGGGDAGADAAEQGVLDAGQRGGEATDASAGTPELDAGGGAPEDSGLPEGPLERDPDRSDKLVIEARRKINDGAFEEAERLLKLAQMYDSRNPRAVAGFGRLYLAKEKGEKALQHIEKAVQARNRRAGYHELLGDARTLTGDLEGALEAYRRAVQLDAHNREARRKLVETRRELEQQ